MNQALAAGRKAFLQAAERLGLPAKEISLIRGALGEIPAVKKGPPDVSVVSPEERLELLAALPLRVRLVAETLYVTGARVSEVLTVRRDQIKTNGSVELRLYGKGGKERTARIPAELYKRILQVFPKGTYLFESSHKKHFQEGVYLEGDRTSSAASAWEICFGSRAAPLTGDGPAGEHEEDQGGLEAARAQRRGDHAEVLCARRVQRRGALRGGEMTRQAFGKPHHGPLCEAYFDVFKDERS